MPFLTPFFGGGSTYWNRLQKKGTLDYSNLSTGGPSLLDSWWDHGGWGVLGRHFLCHPPNFEDGGDFGLPLSASSPLLRGGGSSRKRRTVRRMGIPRWYCRTIKHVVQFRAGSGTQICGLWVLLLKGLP